MLHSPATASEVQGEIVIFHAGSLAVPLQEIARAFESEHPGARVRREAAGSRHSARKISDLGRACDVMASADYAVIDTLLIPVHAAWNIKFAANEMVIAFTDKSRYANEINQDNWHGIILRPEVACGRSDPNADPCGYRTILTAKLAEKKYGVHGFTENLLAKDWRFMRPKETDLLALLATETIDYIFIYRSVAMQHGLRFLTLPDEINLKRDDLAEHYASVAVEISGAEPGNTITRVGEPMIYSVTIPHNAPNPNAALAFVAFLLDADKGIAIMEKNGQPGVVPSVSTTYHAIPKPLKPYATAP
ncbi:MAG TPA: extracellular solute-binding protein [Candidatus Hydrogenedentes bacterium]|nr:extracellular solute-binding protein [Candidatus Hydrogenedentota bacterium]